MNQDLLDNQHWVDIISPPPPESHLLLVASVIFLFVITSTLILAYFWQKRPAQTARRKINKLSKKIATDDTTNRQILADLSKVLCERYNVSQLSGIKIDNAHWPDFFQQLTTACYQATVPDNEKTSRLVKQACAFVHKMSK
jgi:hypothetical protein